MKYVVFLLPLVRGAAFRTSLLLIQIGSSFVLGVASCP